MFIEKNLSEIANSGFNGITVSSGKVQKVTLYDRICQILSRFFGCNAFYRQKADETCNFFSEVFGNERFKRASRQAGIDLEALKARGDFFTKKKIEQLFVQLAMVTVKDLEEVAGKSLSELTTHEIDELYQKLLPFDSSDDLLCQKNSLEDTTTIVLNKSQMQWQVARACELMRHKKLSREEWEVYFAKRLSPPQFPHGLIVRHPNGYLHYSGSIENKGTSKLIFRSLGSQKLATHVLYRGTRGPMPTDTMQQAFHTFREDFTKELGAVGVMRSYKDTKQIFAKEENLHFIGFSLGGAHAMRDAVLFTEQTSRVVTVNAPGIDKETAFLFASRVKTLGRLLEIVHNNDPDDFIDAVGQCHLGLGCEPEHARITIRTYVPSFHADKYKIVPVVKRLKMHLPLHTLILGIRAHIRPTSALKHTCFVLSNADGHNQDLHDHLDHHPRIFDKRWERVRSLASHRHTISFCTFANQALSKN